MSRVRDTTSLLLRKQTQHIVKSGISGFLRKYSLTVQSWGQIKCGHKFYFMSLILERLGYSELHLIKFKAMQRNGRLGTVL